MKLQQLPNGTWVDPAAVSAVLIGGDFTYSDVHIIVAGVMLPATSSLNHDEAKQALAEIVDAIHRGRAAGNR